MRNYDLKPFAYFIKASDNYILDYNIRVLNEGRQGICNYYFIIVQIQ